MNVRSSNSALAAIGVIAVLLLLPGLAAAQSSDGLYGAGAPDDAAFVRLVNGVDDGPLAEVWVGATRFEPVAPLSASQYRPVSPGIHQISVGGESEELIPRRAKYYSVVVSENGLHILEDSAHTRPDRAQIFLYNFSDVSPMALRTADGSTAVIGDVASGTSSVVEVNPVPLEFALFHSVELVAAIGDPGLERGQSYSVFVFGRQGQLRVIIEQAAIAPE